MTVVNVAQRLLSQLTLEEKISLLSGADTWHTQEIARLGVGSIKTTDGPCGARGKYAVDGTTAAFVPSPVCQAATWSKPLLRDLGRLLCCEARTKSAHVLLAPTICCARNPLGGRNFECFGEDPHLSGSLAIEYVAGVQETGQVAATPKHFVANEQEFQRFSIDAQIDEKSFREIYLRPFEMVVRSPLQPKCIMTAYNMINGHHADMSIKNLQDILRHEWGFDGLVMSDWGGTNSTVDSLLAGLDLEMPGPPEQRGAKLVDAWSRARPEEKEKIKNAVDVSVARVLDLAGNYGLLGLTPEAARATRDSPESSSTTPEDIKLMRRIAANGTVLLKNDCKTLPLAAERIRGKQIAFLGPNALQGIPGGGGSATMNPQYLSHPMTSFKSVGKELGIELGVKHALGARGRKWLPLLQSAQWHARSSEPSSTSLLRLDYYSTLDLSGPILETQLRGSSLLDLSDTAPDSLRTDPVPPYSFCITSALTPATDGNHTFSICSIGEALLYVDNEVVVDNRHWKQRGESFYTFGSVEAFGSKKMQADKEYTITIKTWTRVDPDEDVNVHFAAHPSIRIGFEEELGTREALCQEAITLANESEVSIVVLGLTDEWESEGYDRQFMGLPGDQDYLADSLLRRVKRPEDLVFVNQSGSPVELPWIDQAATFVQTFYGGQEAGNALADILLGVVNPSGHLPVTWPKRYADLCFARDAESWPGVDGKVYYKEGSQVGYRWYVTHASVSPQWWFGYGESYTTFDTKISNAANKVESWQVTVRVENTGGLAGSLVVQLYMWPENQKEHIKLIGFEKTTNLDPRAFEVITVEMRKRDAASWKDGIWRLKAGKYILGVGNGVGDMSMETWEASEEERAWQPNE